MKKLLTLLLSLLMVFALVGCGPKGMEEQPVDVPIADVTEPEGEEPIVGGFVDVEDRTLTDELKEIFNKAKEGYVGMSLEPVELYQTQVVAGTNYKFVCSGSKTTNPPISGTYFVTVYQDLQGNCSITDVETVVESTGDVDGDPNFKEVDETMNYWVVFYNPDGNELQRSAIKYGTIPTYNGDTPQYWDSNYWYQFVCWTDKQGNEIKEFKPITGNTYIYAKYEIGGELKQEAAPAPSNLVSVTFVITDGANCNGSIQEINSLSAPLIMSGTQIQFPAGTDFSTDGDKITIEGVTYVARYPGRSFCYWNYNDNQVTSGQITEDSTITANFGPQ